MKKTKSRPGGTEVLIINVFICRIGILCGFFGGNGGSGGNGGRCIELISLF